MKKKLIGYAMCYRNRTSFVIVERSFYKNDSVLLRQEAKELSQKMKKKIFIKKVYYSI